MENELNSVRVLCKSGCGFFGSQATDGYCSLCYKKNLKKQQQSLSSPAPAPSNTETLASTVASPVMETAAGPAVPQQISELPSIVESKQDQVAATEQISTSGNELKKKNRCAFCRKKVGLTGFNCRCGGLFCPMHRYSDKHNCTFDYKEMGAQEIKLSNPVVVAEKVQKI